MRRSVRSRSLKSAGRHDGRSDIVTEQFSDTDLDIHDNGCRWSFRLFLDSPIIQAYKFTSSRFLKKMSEIPTFISGPKLSVIVADEGSNNREVNQQELPSCDSATETSDNQDSFEVQRGLLPTSFDQSSASPSANTSISSVGWPLLHQPFLAKGASFNSTSSQKMSVIEWALQLPDRPKEILNQGTNLKEHHMESNIHWRENQDNIGEEIGRDCALGMSNAHLCNESSVKCKLKEFCRGKLCKEFQFLELLVATGNFSPKKIIGKGGCSQVYRGLLSDGEMVAVKRLNKSNPNSEEEFLTEVEIISNLDHCCIAKFLGYCTETQHYFLVYKLASEGNLEAKLHGSTEKSVLSWDARFKVAIGIAEALNYLHDGCAQPVIHRDVKSSNILLSSNLQPQGTYLERGREAFEVSFKSMKKHGLPLGYSLENLRREADRHSLLQLADFGLAKWAPTTSTQILCTDIVGTFGYLAPEYLMFGKVSEKTDVYSFGVVLLELITGRKPINGSNQRGEESLVPWARGLLKDESNFHRLIDPNLDGVYSVIQLRNMIIAASNCLQQSPHSRPSMHQILRLLSGETEALGNTGPQESICDDGYDMLSYGKKNIQSYLALAMVGLDDDTVSHDNSDHGINLARSYKFLLEYLCGRYTQSHSFA